MNQLSVNKNETAYSFECVYNNHIKPTFGNKAIDEIIRRNIEQLQYEMLRKNIIKINVMHIEQKIKLLQHLIQL